MRSVLAKEKSFLREQRCLDCVHSLPYWCSSVLWTEFIRPYSWELCCLNSAWEKVSMFCQEYLVQKYYLLSLCKQKLHSVNKNLHSTPKLSTAKIKIKIFFRVQPLPRVWRISSENEMTFSIRACLLLPEQLMKLCFKEYWNRKLLFLLVCQFALLWKSKLIMKHVTLSKNYLHFCKLVKA